MQNTSNTLRIAVRKFAPFERTMKILWQRYCDATGCRLRAEMIPMDLPDLHKATIGDRGLKTGEWDIAHINTDWIYEAYRENLLEDLSPYINKNPPLDYPQGWSESLLQLQRFGNHTAGLPFHDGPECLVYRKDLFDDPLEKQNFLNRFGQPLEPPVAWDDFYQISRFFHRPDQNLYGSVFAARPDGHNTVFDFCLQLWSRGGSLTDSNGKIKLNTSEAAEGLDFYRKILDDKYAVHPRSPEYESVMTGAAFARGEAAMMVNWFGFASVCEVAGGSLVKGKVDVCNLPCTVGHQPASLNVYWLYTLGIGSRHKDLAYDFLRFAIRPENDKTLTLEGGIGCRMSTWYDEEVNHTIPYYHKLSALHENAKALPQQNHWVQTAAIIDQTISNALKTTIPSAELLEKAQLKVEQLIKKDL